MDQVISSRLLTQNPWWERRKVPEALLGRPRDVGLDELLYYKEIKVITGVRRSGKSTLMFQLINKLLNSGTQP